jgi:hypothetical protein
MIKQFFKIGGVKNEKEFLAKYPTEESFFRQHPEALGMLEQQMPYMPSYSDMIMPQAMYGMGMAYGGYVPYAANGMQVGNPPQEQDYPDHESWAAAMDQYMASLSQPQTAMKSSPASSGVGYMAPPKQQDYPDYESYSQAMDQYLSSLQQQADSSQAMPQGAPVSAPSPYVPTNKFNLKDYKGVSIVDFLAAQGKPADFASRKQLAASLGIANYRGTASQNSQMLSMLQQAPDALSDYQGVTQPTGNVTKAASRGKNANAAPTTEQLAAAKQKINPYDYMATPLVAPEGGIDYTGIPYADAQRIGRPGYYGYGQGSIFERIPVFQSQSPASQAAPKRNVVASPSSSGRANTSLQKNTPPADPFAKPDHSKDVVKRDIKSGRWVHIPDPAGMMTAENARRMKLAEEMNAREAAVASGQPMFRQGFEDGGSWNGTWNGNQGFGAGGSYLPDYASSAYGLPQFELGAPIYADGGMSPEEAMMMQQQGAAPEQGGGMDQQQVVQAIMQMIQQGMGPDQIMQQLVQGGVPPEMAQQLIQMVMMQVQGGQGGMGGGQPNGVQQPMAPASPEQGMEGMQMPGGMARGGMVPGWEGEVTMDQLEELRRKGIKFDII